MTILQEHGIQPSAQRVAVADYVLQTIEHPSADLVWNRVKARVPYISRATVYNTLNLFVEKGLLRALTLAEDSVVFDPNVERHHHLSPSQPRTNPTSSSSASPSAQSTAARCASARTKRW